LDEAQASRRLAGAPVFETNTDAAASRIRHTDRPIARDDLLGYLPNLDYALKFWAANRQPIHIGSTHLQALREWSQPGSNR
jgi:hypothetical protein